MKQTATHVAAQFINTGIHSIESTTLMAYRNMFYFLNSALVICGLALITYSLIAPLMDNVVVDAYYTSVKKAFPSIADEKKLYSALKNATMSSSSRISYALLGIGIFACVTGAWWIQF